MGFWVEPTGIVKRLIYSSSIGCLQWVFVSHRGAARISIIENEKDRPYYNIV
jgi:hypothetical protein